MPHNKSDKAKIKPQKKVPKKISETYLHNSGLYYLERFAASKAHFITVMSRKAKRSCMHHTEQNYDECVEMVRKLADKFEKVGLLDDHAYTSARVSSLRRKGLSKTMIVQNMRIKGIQQEQTLSALLKLDEENHDDAYEAEKAAALRLAKKKKIGPYFIHNNKEQDIRKSMGMLARAGFSYDIVRTVLEHNLDEEEY